jgi:hypothetical protein
MPGTDSHPQTTFWPGIKSRVRSKSQCPRCLTSDEGWLRVLALHCSCGPGAWTGGFQSSIRSSYHHRLLRRRPDGLGTPTHPHTQAQRSSFYDYYAPIHTHTAMTRGALGRQLAAHHTRRLASSSAAAGAAAPSPRPAGALRAFHREPAADAAAAAEADAQVWTWLVGLTD